MKLQNLFEADRSLVGLKVDGVDAPFTKDPLPILYGDLDVRDLKLDSLEGCPTEIRGDFKCHKNFLTSFKHGPKKVYGEVDARFNMFDSLDGCPEYVETGIYLQSLKLKNLDGLKGSFGGLYVINAPSMTDLGDIMLKNTYDISFTAVGLTNLKDIHKKIHMVNGFIIFTDCPIKSHVLGLLLIPGIKSITFESRNKSKNDPIIEVGKILNRGLKDKNHWTEVQAELEEAGFEEYAQL